MLFTFLCVESASGSNKGWLTWVFVGVLVLLVAALLIVPMFTNKKRAKEETERNNSLHPGDVIETIGGIIGTILEIRQVSPTEKELVIETGVGDNKTTMRLDIRALATVITRAVVEPTESEQAIAGASETADTATDTTDHGDIPAVEPETAAESNAEVAEKPVDTAEEPVSAPAEQAATEETPVNTAEETATVAESTEPVKTPTKRAPSKSAGKSNSAGKSTSKKSTAKKSAETDNK